MHPIHPDDYEFPPSVAEINAERYHAELADLRREADAAYDESLFFYAKDLGVSEAEVLAAEEDYQSHESYRWLARRIHLLEEETINPLPF